MKKPILITGAHRSGSTWIGKMISSSQEVRYIHEPFNLKNKRKDSPFVNWFEHLNNDSSDQDTYKRYIESFDSIFHKDNRKRVFKCRNIRDVYNYLVGINGRLLLKDPIAVMSAEWMYDNFNCDVIISIRHPAAFVASLKEKNWHFNFNDFLSQDDLMNTYLKDYKEIIKQYSENEQDIVQQGILLWNAIYSTVLGYKNKYGSSWYFVRHEDLSREPVPEFEKIFNYLNIRFDPHIKKRIIASSTSKKKSGKNRDSKTNIYAWKNKLSPEEIITIKEGTRPVWDNFYSESDWK